MLPELQAVVWALVVTLIAWLMPKILYSRLTLAAEDHARRFCAGVMVAALAVAACCFVFWVWTDAPNVQLGALRAP
jgi:uncharacterized membrane protein YhhN